METLLLIVAVILLIVATVIIIHLRSERNQYRRKAGRREVVKRKMEFSKLILLLVMVCYFMGVGVGIWLSLIDPMQYSTLAMLIGAPTAAAIGFYCWKAKAENTIKIKKDNPVETEGTTLDLNNII